MARIARVVVPGCAYHVTHRGNRREDVFFREEDRSVYRDLLRECAQRYSLEIWAYCWMTNHVHLVVVGHSGDSLARGLGNSHRRYSQYVNRRHGWSGHLWSNRFYSTPLDVASAIRAARYVELNPVRAGLVAEADDYPWSSARAHVRGEADVLLSPRRPIPESLGDWAAWLRRGLASDQVEELRANTCTGRPTGSPDFVQSLESTLGRCLRPRRRGPSPVSGVSGTATEAPESASSALSRENRVRDRSGRHR